MGERVELTLGEGVAEVRMTRPEKHNALDLSMFEALDAVQGRLGAEAGVRVVVLSGEGPSFCSGLDVAAVSAGELDPRPLIDRPNDEIANLAQRAAFGWRMLPVPVIAAVHGVCFGGGLQIALGADLRIADPVAQLSVMEVRLGLVPDMALSQTLPGVVREDVARELTYTGRIVAGEEAAALGLVTRVEADPRGAALELAAEIAARSPDAIRAIKRLFEEAVAIGPERGLRFETELVQTLLGTPNQLEAARAAISGETPKFTDP